MAIRSKTSLRTAWKESEAVVRAMGDGKQFLLLSRASTDPGFTEARLLQHHLEFFLLPDPESTRREEIRPEFHSYLDGESDNNGQQVTLRYRVIVTEATMVMEPAQLRDLAPFHIWTDEYVRRQTRWDPHDPTYLVTCKVQRIDPPPAVAFREEYRKQGPWVEIDEDLPPVSFEEVVPHTDYLKVAIDVKKALAELQKNPMEKPAPEAEAPPAAAAPAKPDAGTPAGTAS